MLKYLLAILISFCFLGVTSANALPARFSADGYVSTEYPVGQVDLMLPLKGDAEHNFYIDPALAYGSDSQGYADLGVGYRWVKNNAAILGGYLFGGYSRIDNNARLWVVNPGIEALGSRWDAHLNGYLAMGDRNTAVSSFLSFDEFTGHSELFNLFDVTQHAGNGADVKFGYQLFPSTPLKAYVGSYFFSPSETNNVLGGAVGLEYWLDQNIKVFANYTYDNLRRSVGAFGIGFELGGTHVHRSDPSVEERITDPVERYLAELGRGSSIPSQKKTQFIGLIVPANRDDDAFFSQTGTPNNGGMGLTLDNCTFENPCGPTDLTNQGTQTLATLLPNTRMFFGGGAYSALDVPGGINPVTIRTGQSIAATPGTSPSTFNGGFILEGNNSLNDIILLPTVSTATGPGVSATGGNVLINNSQIGSMANPFATGLAFSGNTQAKLTSSMVFASNSGVTLADSASLTVDPSTINVNGGDNIVGINSSSSGSLNVIQGSSVNVTGGNNLIGISTSGSGNFVLSDASSINVTGAMNIFGLASVGAGTVTVSGASSVNLTGSGDAAVGFYYEGSGPVIFSEGSEINVNAPGQNAIVGFTDTPAASGDITFDASFINVTGGDSSFGLGSSGTGNLNIINNSAFNITAGNDSSGIDVTGDRIINLLNSTLTFSGGNDSFGFDSTGNGNVTINDSMQNFTGGSGFAGLNTGGAGSISVSGSTLNVTAGNTSDGYSIEGSGPVNFTDSSITMNAAGATSAAGFLSSPGSTSNIILSRSQITVNQGGDNSTGIFTQGSGTLNLVTANLVNVNGTGTLRGVRAVNNSSITGSDLNLIVAANNVSQAQGLATANTGTISLNGVDIDVSGSPAFITVAAGGLITLTGTNVCILNGNPVAC